MDRDLGTGNAIYVDYEIDPEDGGRLVLLNTEGERLVVMNSDYIDAMSIGFSQLTGMTQELTDAMRRMDISIEDWVEYTDDSLQDSHELDEFLSEFVVTQKDEVS